ncbi:tetratricopeptide repeat protein [Amycolatopsis sp. A133]|uniref:ATP-binding protein n=1 Tax=Amycolatopsis sp. A133 TaxID=3064472 RepID=UPI0027FFA29E|nr:tetratricopeptide repeat protein [Amycolatopsis sp. A133]MDQ7808410.1 tetratricopeptide repeat protein [Amycolatopsis sp. A133]
MSRDSGPNAERFHRAIKRAVDHLGGDRAASAKSGVNKTVWYGAKENTIPKFDSTWPKMLSVLVDIPHEKTGVQDWDRLYAAAAAEVGRPVFETRQANSRVATADPTSGPPQQLPGGPTYFAARDGELAELDQLLRGNAEDTPPIAVVIGPPGVGKTALAVRWARSRASAFADGVLYSDLRGWGTDDPADIEELVASWLRQLGLSPAAMPDDLGSRAALLRSTLARRRMLLVLDNAHTEEQIRPLLPGTSSCSVLVTSRHVLPGLAIHHSAHPVRLGVLSAAESAGILHDLIGQRADDEPEAVTSLGELCGHLPLVLLIVAQLAREREAASLSGLVSELADAQERLDQLDSEDPRSDPRTVFSWSYHQVPVDAALVFRRIGLFPGKSFDLATTCALTGLSSLAASRALRALVRANLVAEISPGRFEMHDLLRLYAQDVLGGEDEPDLVASARMHLFDYYLHATWRADQLIEPHRYRLPLESAAPVAPPFDDREGAMRWLDVEYPTVVALCRQDLVEFDGHRWRLAFQLRSYFFRTKRIYEWIESHEGALAAAIRSGDELGEAMTRSNLGVALHERNDDAAALPQFEQAERLFTTAGDLYGVSNSLANQAVVHRRSGDFQQALDCNRRALAFYREKSAQRYVAITLRSVALVALELARLDEAEVALTESLEICAALDMDMDAARSWNTLGQVHLLARRYGSAEAAHRTAIDVAGQCGARFEEARARRGLGRLALAVGEPAEAERHWQDALRLLEEVGAPSAEEVRAELVALSSGPASPRSTRE